MYLLQINHGCVGIEVNEFTVYLSKQCARLFAALPRPYVLEIRQARRKAIQNCVFRMFGRNSVRNAVKRREIDWKRGRPRPHLA